MSSIDSFGGEILRVHLRDVTGTNWLMGKQIDAERQGVRITLERNGAFVTKGDRRAWIPASNILGVEWA